MTSFFPNFSGEQVPPLLATPPAGAHDFVFMYNGHFVELFFFS